MYWVNEFHFILIIDGWKCMCYKLTIKSKKSASTPTTRKSRGLMVIVSYKLYVFSSTNDQYIKFYHQETNRFSCGGRGDGVQHTFSCKHYSYVSPPTTTRKSRGLVVKIKDCPSPTQPRENLLVSW